MKDKRFIEVAFPVKAVSEESVREKNIRHGHISTLHIWWARRPLASSRATNYAALIPAPKDEKEIKRKKRFIAKLSKWESSLDSKIIRRAREDIINYFRKINKNPMQERPRILDPFAGGGSITLEALRLGCETYAIDYNPVAVLILKAVIEYPQKYGRGDLLEKWSLLKENREKGHTLIEDIEKWGKWVLEEARKELERFYPRDEDGYIPVGYIWARTIRCQNPACGVEIPLVRYFWLSKKRKKVALFPYIDGKEVKFKIVGEGYEPMPEGFDPSKGTVRGAKVTCPVCGMTHDANTTRRLFREGKVGQKMIIVVLHSPKKSGVFYRLPTDRDIEAYKEAKHYLEEKRMKLIKEWGLDPVPDEPVPEGNGRGAERAFSVKNYGIKKWGDLFNDRQKLALITFVEKIRKAYDKMIEEGYDKEYAKAIATYLALRFDLLATYLNVLVRWRGDTLSFERSFDRQVLQILWDYGEVNPFSGRRGSWDTKKMKLVIEHCIRSSNKPATVFQASATSLPFPDNFFDAVFTDPPYYDNVPYSYLSDFFYVWLKRAIGELYPELFITPLTPKSKELVAYTIGKSWELAKKHFEKGLKEALKEIYRVLKPSGILVLVYAHKTTEGWETLINSLLDSGLLPTATWPIHTEMMTRLRAKESAALASSIYIVARKIKKRGIGWFEEIKRELKETLKKKLDTLWKEGIGGADFFIAAIGSAIEVFGKYEKVLDYEGNEIRGDRLLQLVRDIVTDYAIRQVLHENISSELSPLTKFYVLWRWAYGEAKVAFDEARKLATSVGLDLGKEWNRGFIVKEKELVRVLGPQDRKLREIKGNDLIDVLHKVLLLWQANRKKEMIDLLAESGWGNKDIFYKVAQVISEVLPSDSKEKKLLEGFLAGREYIKNAITKKNYSVLNEKSSKHIPIDRFFKKK